MPTELKEPKVKPAKKREPSRKTSSADVRELTSLEKLYALTYSRRGFVFALDLVSYFAVVATVTAYVLTVVSLIFLKKDVPLTLDFILTTGVPFCAVSIFRRFFNAPRPYELCDFSRFTDAQPRKKGGRSFPSRHTFSSFVIGTSLLFIHIPVGIFVLILGLFLGFCRICKGIHFPRDIVAGALIGAISGVVGMLIGIYLI